MYVAVRAHDAITSTNNRANRHEVKHSNRWLTRVCRGSRSPSPPPLHPPFLGHWACARLHDALTTKLLKKTELRCCGQLTLH